MGRLKLIGSNLVTATLVCALTSAFWINAYGGESTQHAKVEPAPEAAEKQASAATAKQEVALAPSGLAVPVAGITVDQLTDTYKQSRGGGSRVHDAIDIMADHGTPVVAAAPGRLEKLFYSKGGGGITAYVRSDDGKWLYYYAHLQDYAPGLKEGQAIKRGDPIGRVGVTGNSNPDGPHLHFAINRMADGEKWHQGRPVNPYPLLAGKNGR
ncbi:MAG TPA: M23 family metallopeptidase [Allosphingosinicella sp.]|jgi:murein DD-endopeptidase MepM/ murein hydrolase activator NlpD|uniref:M23 family metallopeptidase n=1 Tax=Allosphingosinicella sp. TaxID=2823234 RepID=UPI002F288F0C